MIFDTVLNQNTHVKAKVFHVDEICGHGLKVGKLETLDVESSIAQRRRTKIYKGT